MTPKDKADYSHKHELELFIMGEFDTVLLSQAKEPVTDEEDEEELDIIGLIREELGSPHKNAADNEFGNEQVDPVTAVVV